MNRMKNLLAGIVKNNPTFVLMLGMCPTLATTTSAVNGAGMGVATMAVLIMSNVIISLVKNIVPSKIRIPAYIVVIAALVTIVELLMKAYLTDLYKVLGIFIPLIVVNCIILGRAEGFAAKNGVLDSAIDGLGVGLGFTLSLTVIGAVRELLGNLTIFNWPLVAKLCYVVNDVVWWITNLFGHPTNPHLRAGDGILIFVLAPGAFIVLGYLMVLFNKLTAKMR